MHIPITDEANKFNLKRTGVEQEENISKLDLTPAEISDMGLQDNYLTKIFSKDKEYINGVLYHIDDGMFAIPMTEKLRKDLLKGVALFSKRTFFEGGPVIQ
jgi:hypothetical protein